MERVDVRSPGPPDSGSGKLAHIVLSVNSRSLGNPLI
jgi:hypothetical protein